VVAEVKVVVAMMSFSGSALLWPERCASARLCALETVAMSKASRARVTPLRGQRASLRAAPISASDNGTSKKFWLH
jgi:hypothetical protein